MVRVAAVGAALVLPWVVLHGCGQVSDPSVPCAAMDLGAAAPATVTSLASAPVLVVSAEDPTPFVIVRVCPVDAPCVYYRQPLPGPEGETSDGPAITPGSALMVTALGNYVVGIDRELGGMSVWAIDTSAREIDGAVGPLDRFSAAVDDDDDVDRRPAVLVASLRHSDLLLVRDEVGGLAVFHPTWRSLRPIAQDHPNLKVVAIGEQWIVGREEIDGEDERLLLVPVDPELETFDAVELAEADGFTRVEMTVGDELVVATSGDGDGAETFVFDVESGALVDRFIGSAVTSLRELDAVPGLRATSPDGSHLAFRTSTGAVALRDLDTHSSCLVRSSTAGDHRVAGFGADGTIYMQAELAYTESRVFAFETRTRSLVALDIEPGTGHHLAAVPSRLRDGERPWAIGVHHGQYAAMQEEAEPTNLGIYDATWIARDDDVGGMWAVEAYRDEAAKRHLALRRFEPTMSGRRYEFPRVDPRVLSLKSNALSSLADLDNSERPCMSVGTPGAWAYRCAGSAAVTGFAASPVPSSEDPGAPEMPDPEVPDYGEPEDAADDADSSGDESSSDDAD